MAKKLVTSYTFTPGAAGVGTVVVPGTYALEQFLLVTNVTSNVIIYEFDSAPLGGAVSTGGGNTTLTLDYSTSSMSSGDRLQVFIDDATTGTSVTVSNTSGNPVPISAAALPLPSGAATAAKQPALGTAGVSSTDVITVQGIASGTPQPISGSVSITGTPSVTVSGTAAVSAASLPLPTGAATETTLSTLNGKIPSSLTVASTRLLVDGSGVTQPVSGTVAVSGTTAISAASLPLPTGAATSAKQPALGTAGTPSTDVLTVQGATSMTALKVDGSGVTQPVSGPLTDTQLRASAVPVSGTVAVSGTTAISAASLPLPSGAATAAKQPALGTAGVASTDVITVQGIASGTPQPISGSVSVTGTPSVTVSGTAAVSAASLPLPTGAATETTLSTLSGKIPASLTVTSTRLLVDGSGVTQPVSGSVSVSGTAAISAASLPLPTGAATAAKQPALGTAGTPSADVLTVQGATSMTALKVDGSGVTQPVSGSVTVSGTVTASGPLTDTQLRATAVPVSGTITANAGTNLNTSALALETGGNLASINTKLPTLSLGAQAQSAALAVSPANKLTVTGPAAQSAINTDLITGNVNGWYDAAGYNYVSFTIIASAGISSGAFQIETTNDTVNDASGAVCPSFADNGSNSSTISVTSLSLTASVNQRRGCYLASRYVRVRLNSAVVGGTVQCVGVFSNAPTDCPGLIKRIDIASIGLNQISSPTVNGVVSTALAILSVSGLSNNDYTSQNVAATSGSLATIGNANNFATLTFDVNLTAFTAGSSTGLDLYLQESPDNGTTFYDIWQCEAFTAAGRARIPAIPVNGRRRFRWVNRTGAATTATLTVNSNGTSAAVPIQRQFFDRTSGVGSGTAVISTSSAAYDIAGCKQFTVVMQAGTATAVGSFQAQMSMDGTNWYNASAATAIGATTANNTIIPITSGLTGRFIRVTCTAAGTTQVINAIHIYGTN